MDSDALEAAQERILELRRLARVTTDKGTLELIVAELAALVRLVETFEGKPPVRETE